MLPEEHRRIFLQILSLIDLTSLEGTDSTASAIKLCRKALHYRELGLPLPAAVCLFSPFIRTARKELAGSGVKVATVAGGFPHGQIPLKAKMEEVTFAMDEGAEEIDIVFSRGVFLSGGYNQIADEIGAIREISNPLILKVILETGELQTKENIALAADITIRAGADFIKTSTGKIPVGATREAVQTMLTRIRVNMEESGKKTGIKPSGGISTPEDALSYYNLVSATLGEEWLNNNLFRIGASRLADQLADKIEDC